MTLIDEEELANEAMKLLQSIDDNIDQEEFCPDDIISYGPGPGQPYGYQHLRYLLDEGYVVKRSPDNYTITEAGLARLT